MATKPKTKPETTPNAASKSANAPVPKIVQKAAPKTTPSNPAKHNNVAAGTKIVPNVVEALKPKAASISAKPTIEPKTKAKPKVAVPSKAQPTSKTDSNFSAKVVQKSASKTGVKSVVKAAPSTNTPKFEKWQEIRVILEKIKEETLREISKSVKNGTDAVATNEPGGDIYDQASSERDRELGLLLGDREREKLHSIDEALLRIDEDEYGICEECDEDIPLGRLKAMPFTRHCVKCKSDLEKLQAQTKRFEEDRAYREIPLGSEEEEA